MGAKPDKYDSLSSKEQDLILKEVNAYNAKIQDVKGIATFVGALAEFKEIYSGSTQKCTLANN